MLRPGSHKGLEGLLKRTRNGSKVQGTIPALFTCIAGLDMSMDEVLGLEPKQVSTRQDKGNGGRTGSGSEPETSSSPSSSSIGSGLL